MLNTQIGQYRITGKLGQGGMGEIFSALDEKLNRTVAVKFIANSRLDSDTSRRLFLREARAAAALDHPFICSVHDVLEHAGQPVIIMERVEGETLQQRVRRGPLAVDELVRVSTEIAEALAAAHARGIIHRDIKSANIMLTPSGHVKVMDFGLAVVITSSPEEQTAHMSQEIAARVVGTLPYIAPEILRGEKASAASDIYAFGVVMYELATGRQPFDDKTDALVIAEILDHAVVPPRRLSPSLPRLLDDLIVRMLSKNAARRPGISELQGALTTRAESKQRSLAVLPFQSLTPDAGDANLGLALADAVTSELALVRSLLVRPTAAILRYQGWPDPITAACELGVDAVVAGTVQRAASRVRVTVQLVSAAEERPLWSTKIDATVEDVFAMQDEVSRKIVEALQLELTPADEQRLGNHLQASGDVRNLLFEGRLALLRETIPDVNAAIESFERAHQLEPANPLPLLGLADAYNRLAFTWDPDGGWYKRAQTMCERALQLDPNIPEGRYIRGSLAWTPQGSFDHEYAIREIAAAVAERPNLTEGYDWLAKILFHVGLIDEAGELYDRALAINPDETQALIHLATLELIRGNFAAARKTADAVPEPGETSWNAYTAIIAEFHSGELAAAEAMLDTAFRKFPGMVLFDSASALGMALRSNEPGARRAIESTQKRRKEFAHFHHAQFDIACALAVLGHAGEALTWLADALHGGFPCLPAVENEPLLASLRGEPQYRSLIAELRQTHDHFAALWNELHRQLTSSS